MTPREAAEVVAMLTMAFPDQKWSEGTCTTYEQALADIDFEAAKAATLRVIGTSRFRPSVAEIREAAATVVHGERRTGTDAWGDVTREIRRVGGYGRPKFADPITAKAVESLGWRALCWGSAPEASDRARFVELYDALSEAERRRLVSEPGRISGAAKALPGQAETPKRQLPDRAPNPVGDLLAGIGNPNPKKARAGQ